MNCIYFEECETKACDRCYFGNKTVTELLDGSPSWTQCKDCVYFDDCLKKEDRDGCCFGATEADFETNTGKED